MNTTPTGLVHHLRNLAARQTLDSLPDQQLLENFLAQRSEASFAAMMRRHGPMVLSVCRRVLHHEQDAEDAFQAAFFVFARKAGSIRKSESLGSWLHGVAYRIAERLKAKEARRVAHERRLPSQPPGDAVAEISWRELRDVLDEELARLPEKYRAPLVLCYLEGKTQDEAARQLGVSKGTCRRRLQQGRDALGRRLRHRGLALSAALSAPLLLDSTATAALPPLLVASTVRASLASAMGQATGALVSAQVAALVEGGTCTLLAKKATVPVVLLASLTLGLGGLLTHRVLQTRGVAEAPAAPVAPTLPPQPARGASKDKTIEVKGRVLDPDGKPLTGAKVYLSSHTSKDKRDPKLRAETDGNGRFHFTVGRDEADEEEMIATVAPEFGPDWLPLKDAGGELTLRLVKDDVPIEGRVLDLEGRPIAGVTVRIASVRKMPGEDLTPWLRELQTKPKDRNAASRVTMKYQRFMTFVWDILGSPKSVKTDADGRFQLRGFGRDRIVDLRIEGPGIEYRHLTVISRPGLAKELPLDMHGPTFDHLAAPSKPIRGTVRDKGSGKPAAGMYVSVLNGGSAITDKEGHYEILGIRKSENYFLNVGGPPVVGYFKEAKDTPGLQPLTVDFEVQRALVLHVRVTEKGTGKPVRGYIYYDVRGDNPSLDRYTTYPRNDMFGMVNEKDGSVDVVVLPGRGFIAVRALEDRFLQARPAGHMETILHPHDYHAVVSINPSEKEAKSLICNIALDPGNRVSGVVVGPDDRPLSGVSMTPLGNLWVPPLEREQLLAPDGRFIVGGLEPAKPRTAVFWHESKGLARAIVVRGEEKAPLTVRLEPRGAVKGQLVDARGRPLRGIEVRPQLSDKQAAPLPYLLGRALGGNHPRDVVLPVRVFTDVEGRFRIKGFVSGLNYSLVFGDKGKEMRKEISVKPGATVDVGEIKTKTAADITPARK